MHERSAIEVHSGPEFEDRPLKDLVADFGRDMGLLVRQEVQLAKAEINEKISNVAKGAVAVGLGVFLAWAGALALVAALVLIGIAIGITPWLSAVIVGVLLLVVGYVMIQRGRQRVTEGPAPLERTRQTSKETVQQLKEQLR